MTKEFYKKFKDLRQSEKDFVIKNKMEIGEVRKFVRYEKGSYIIVNYKFNIKDNQII